MKEPVNHQSFSMTEKLKYGLYESDLNQVISILTGNPKITSLVLFGSRAKGTFNNGSDIDIALVGNNIVLNDILDLTTEIEKLALPYRFDLVIYKRIKEKELVNHIKRVGIVLFNKQNNHNTKQEDNS